MKQMRFKDIKEMPQVHSQIREGRLEWGTLDPPSVFYLNNALGPPLCTLTLDLEPPLLTPLLFPGSASWNWILLHVEFLPSCHL